MTTHEENDDHFPFDLDIKHWWPGSFGFHELLDRERLIADLWKEKIAAHPSAKVDEGASQLIQEIGDRMETLYQLLGSMGDAESDLASH